MTIWERVEAALATLGIPFAEGNYQVGDTEDYPDVYMVYSLPSIDPGIYLNDVEKYRPYLVQVSVFKKTTLVGLPDVIGAMTASKFTFSGGRELESLETEETHRGIAFDFDYLEKL